MTTATFTPDVVVCRLAATSKKQLLQQLSALAAAQAGLCERKVLSAIISREKQQHGHRQRPCTTSRDSRIGNTPGDIAGDARTAGRFRSPDNMPVDVMALVLGTKDDSNGYLSTVNAMSRILHQRQARLRDANSDADLRAAIGEPQIVAA